MSTEMDNGKSKENRRARGRRRNSKKEENREFEQTTGESPMWSDSVMDNEDTVGAGTVEKEMSPKLGNGDGAFFLPLAYICGEGAFSGGRVNHARYV